MTGRRGSSSSSVGGRRRRRRWQLLPPEQVRLDLFLPGLSEEIEDRVWDALYQLHMEKGCNRSFRPEEVAARCGLRKADVERMLRRLWRWGMLVKRRNNRYKMRDNFLKACYQVIEIHHRARRASAQSLDNH